jgi:hypothetical protein
MNQFCQIDNGFSFFLSQNSTPAGTFPGEDALSFNPANLTIENKGTYFLIADGNHAMFTFESFEKAKQALDAIKAYGFEASCFVGRPNPGMKYMKRRQPIPERPTPKLHEILEGVKQKFEIGSQPNQSSEPFLLRVEDVFSITGRGTVATGRIETGIIKSGEEVQITGFGTGVRKSVVTGVEMFRKILDKGEAGDNVGLLLRGIEKDEIKRGMIITHLPKKEVIQTSDPQKFELKAMIISKGYSEDDKSVFQGFFSDLIDKTYKWHTASKESITDDKLHTYYYRLTNDPNQVFFLPQVYRIGVDESTGEPRIQINMYKKLKETGEKEYRIRVSFYMVPYFHPRAKKDLMSDLNSKFEWKYVQNLVLGGYKSVEFKLSERHLQGENLFEEKFTESVSNLDPTTGFYIQADHSMESYENFKKELLEGGISVGKILFKLEEEVDGKTVEIESNPINVELNLRALQNIPLPKEISIIKSDASEDKITPNIKLFNSKDFPVKIKGIEFTLLSKIENIIQDVDKNPKTNILYNAWPMIIEGGGEKIITINIGDDSQNIEWTDLICEPYGVQADIDPEKIMASVIDRATGERDIWNLEIDCPLYSHFDSWTEEELLPYQGIHAIQVKLKIDGEPVRSVRLSKDNPMQIIQMSRSAAQLLSTSDTKNRTYAYKVINITLPPSPEPEIWNSSEDHSMNNLTVYPTILKQ